MESGGSEQGLATSQNKLEYEQFLQQWFEAYEAQDLDERWGSLRYTPIDDQELDLGRIADEIEEAKSRIQVNDGICKACRVVLDFVSWPERSWHPFRVAWHSSTAVLEAARYKGCRLCAMLMQSMEEKGLVTTARVIEQRLGRSRPGESNGLTINVDWWEQRFVLRLNYPWKVGAAMPAPGLCLATVVAHNKIFGAGEKIDKSAITMVTL